MIGSFPLYGFWLLMLVCVTAVFCSFIVLLCVLIHYMFREDPEPWPSASSGFRVFLSTGTLVILNIFIVPVWFFSILGTSDDFRQWFDSVVLYAWIPVIVFSFLLIFFGLKVIVPLMSASATGRIILLIWAFLVGTLSVLLAVPSGYIFVLQLFRP